MVMRVHTRQVVKYVYEKQEPTNEELLRDLTYAWQGLDNTIFKWDSANNVTIPNTVPFPLVSLLRELLEPAVLYRYLKQATERVTEYSNGFAEQNSVGQEKKNINSIVQRALLSAVSEELQNYLKVIGYIENEIRRSTEIEDQDATDQASDVEVEDEQNEAAAPAADAAAYNDANDIDKENDRPHGNEGQYKINGNVNNSNNPTTPQGEFSRKRQRKRRRHHAITLRTCLYLLQDTIGGLRFLYDVVLRCAELSNGSQILSLLYQYTKTGDHFVSAFAEKLLRKVSQPFYVILNEWVGNGRLDDPYDDFFVTIENAASRKTTATPLTNMSNKTSAAATTGVNSSSVSSAMSFVLDQDKIPSYMSRHVARQVFETGRTLYFIRVACEDMDWVDQRRANYTDVQSYHNMEQVVNANYKEVVARLNWIMQNKLHLNIHLKGLKDYMLLGRGEFVQLLVEEAFQVLDRPASQLYRHNLTAMLETALRGCSSSTTALHRKSSGLKSDQDPDQEVEQNVDARMLVAGHREMGWQVFTLEYRVAPPLDQILLDKAAERAYLQIFNFLWRIKWVGASLQATWSQLALDARAHVVTGDIWIYVRRTCQEMMHFAHELQYYMSYEVIETAWSQLQTQLNRQDLTVEETIQAHHEYLTQIVRKGLFTSSSNANSSVANNPLKGDLHTLLKCILSFSKKVHTMRQLARIKRPDEQARLEELFQGVVDLEATFHEIIQRLVVALESVEDYEMRFLAVRLDFNDFYKSLKGRKVN